MRDNRDMSLVHPGCSQMTDWSLIESIATIEDACDDRIQPMEEQSPPCLARLDRQDPQQTMDCSHSVVQWLSLGVLMRLPLLLLDHRRRKKKKGIRAD